jgi:formylglycine-generating enzyme required for sulfatase activity
MTAIINSKHIEHPLAAGGGPEWAAECGEDRDFGPFAVLELPGRGSQPPVRQRWRWAPPGSFWMGSPKGEKGRYKDEGPEHLVTLTHGFWVADTPCTQSLWQAVMDSNPSRFQGSKDLALERPVETVSWNDVQIFLSRLNDAIPSLHATLPSEAQWEYACRAGSRDAIFPPAKLSSRHKKRARDTGALTDLDAIAWYYNNSQGRTHPVMQKQPNAWGLYDMLGNVWEWCADNKRPYDDAPRIDPTGPDVGSRCVRGGGWYDYARFIRCAFRDASLPEFSPEDRREDMGFRLVRVQDES